MLASSLDALNTTPKHRNTPQFHYFGTDTVHQDVPALPVLGSVSSVHTAFYRAGWEREAPSEE